MSYINRDTLKLQVRRHRIKRLTPEEAIAKANEVADEANQKIAFMAAQVGQYEQIAQTYEQENNQLRARVAELEAEKAIQQAEIERLKKKVVKRSGKHKGEEWDE